MHIKNARRGFSTAAIIAILALIIAGVGIVYVASTRSSQPASVATTEQAGMEGSSTDATMIGKGSMKAGVYEPYDPKLLANAATGKVILFFHAVWCPTCHTLDADIRAHLNNIPPGVTILETDYDQATVLKQKYGVTTQGTFVQVDQNGTLLKKWGANDTYTLADLLSKGNIQ